MGSPRAKEARLQLDAAELAEQVAALTARLDEEQAAFGLRGGFGLEVQPIYATGPKNESSVLGYLKT